MALEDLFPGRRTLEQERFLDTLFHHAGFWYATEVAGTEEAFVRDGFSRRKQASPSLLDRVAGLFRRQAPVHEHYAEPGFQVVSSRVLSPQYHPGVIDASTASFALSQDEMAGGTHKVTPQQYDNLRSQTVLLDGGNQDPVVEFILSTARQDQTPDGQYRFSSFGLVVPASEARVIQAFVDADPSILDRVKHEMFPAWEAQYPTVPVDAGAHARPEPHPHRAQPRDHRVADLYARLDRVNARIADLGARLARPFDFDAIYDAAYVAAGAGTPATVAVPQYERPEPRRAPEAPRPAPEPRTEPYVRAQPAPRSTPEPEDRFDLLGDYLNVSRRPTPVAPRVPEPRAPYTPSPAEAQRRADYLASLRRPEPETPRVPEPHAPYTPSPAEAQRHAEEAQRRANFIASLQRPETPRAPARPYVAPVQPVEPRPAPVAPSDSLLSFQEIDELIREVSRRPTPVAPRAPTQPYVAPVQPGQVPDVQLPESDQRQYGADAQDILSRLVPVEEQGKAPAQEPSPERAQVMADAREAARQREEYLARLRQPVPSAPVAPAPPAPSVSGEYPTVTTSQVLSVEDIARAGQVAPPSLPSRLDALADDLFPESAPAPLRDVPPPAKPEPVAPERATMRYRYTLEVDDVNPNSGDFPGRVYTVIREGDRVRLESDVFRTMEARLLGAVNLYLGLDHESPLIQYAEQWGGSPQYRYRELVQTILETEPRPTTDFLQELFFARCLGLEPDVADIYANYHVFVAGMPQRPESRMGTEQLAILGRVVKVEELPPDYKAPNLGDAVAALRTYTTPRDEDRTPTLTPPPESERSSQLLSDEELAQLISTYDPDLETPPESEPSSQLLSEEELAQLIHDVTTYDTARETQAVPPIDPRAKTDPSLPTATYGALVPAPDAPKPASLDEAITRGARPRGHGVVYDAAVQSSPGGPGYFGGSAAHDTEVTELGTQDIISAEAVGAEVARRQAEPPVDAEALFNEGVRLIESDQFKEGRARLVQAYQANPTYLDRGQRFARKQLRTGFMYVGGRDNVQMKGLDPDLAIHILDDIISTDATYAPAFADRAVAILRTESQFRLKDAVVDIVRACELEPGNATFQEQREGIQKQALRYLASKARIYGTDHEFGEGSFAYDDYLVIGNHLFLFNIDHILEQKTLVGSIAVKGWTQKTRNKHVQELIGALPNELKDPTKPLVEYQAFLDSHVRLAKEGKSYSPESKQGNYLIAKMTRRRPDPKTGQDLDEVILVNHGRVVSCETAYDKKGREKSGWIANVEHAFSRYYEHKVGRLIPFQELLRDL